MTDLITSLLSHADAFRWIFFIGLVWVFYHWMQGEDSKGIEWRDFISSIGSDKAFHGDINKLGQSVGILIGSVAIVLVSSHAHEDLLGFAAVLAAYFAFVGGVAGYAAFLRSKQSSVTTITEPLPDPPVPAKVTVIETAPVAVKGKKK
jgi:drug/metabolite transporter (DMT)-like permease